MTFKKLESSGAIGTSYQGLMRCIYSELCNIFGQPTTINDGKVQVQWVFEVAGGVPVTIYDYKEDQKPQDLMLWHVGGKNKDAIQLIDIIIKEHRKANK